MSKGKVERPDLIQLKKRAINGWGASPNHVLWMIRMLRAANYFLDRLDYEFDEDVNEWVKEHGKATGT